MSLATAGSFFGLDSVIILLVVVFMFGGKKIPEAARALGQSIREFRKGKDQPDNEPKKL